ncbi:MAG: transcriptional regulator [Phycisphaerae bacterium]|nr:transcriptional regulator [Phycisphaerae bacterium]
MLHLSISVALSIPMPRAPSSTPIPKPPTRRATAAFRRAEGILRTQEAKAAGIHPRTLAALVEDGTVVRLDRGVYQLADAAPSEPDLAVVARKVPKAIVCLVSALAHHRLTTQIPHAVDLAVPRGFKDRKLEHPPVRFYRFGDASFAVGIERIKVGGRELRVYGAAKTVADCFKFRNKIGKDIAIEALRTYLRRKDAKVKDLLHFARINRVQAVMAPYVDVLLAARG